jgi:hypothetical protein
MELEEDKIIASFHQVDKKKRIKLGMIGTLIRINLRKEIWFSSMTINICITQGNSRCIG